MAILREKVGAVVLRHTYMREGLAKLFWFTKPRQLDKKKAKELIIHQTLALGSLEDIRQLFKLYSKPEVKRVFLKGKKGTYDPRVVALLKIMFGIKRLNMKKYVKKIY